MPQHDVCQSGVYNEKPNSLYFRHFLLNYFWARLSSVACCMSVNTQGVKFTKGTYCTFTTRISLPTLQSYFKFGSCMYLTLLRDDSSCPGHLGFKWICTFKTFWHMLGFQLHYMSKELCFLVIVMWLPSSKRFNNNDNDDKIANDLLIDLLITYEL